MQIKVQDSLYKLEQKFGMQTYSESPVDSIAYPDTASITYSDTVDSGEIIWSRPHNMDTMFAFWWKEKARLNHQMDSLELELKKYD